MALELSIIIVNYKTPELTLSCIEKVYESPLPKSECEIIVVDNNSEDHSRDLITQGYPDIIWIQNESNLGFGAANNLGIEKAQGDYLLLLNSDVFVKPDTITLCLEAIKREKRIGALTCTLINPDGRFQKNVWYDSGSFNFFRNESIVLQKFIPFKADQISSISGAFMLIPKYVFSEIKPFDPDFFMFGEEMELCHRVKKAGYKLVCINDAQAYHIHGGSTSHKYWGKKHRHLSNAFLYYKIHGAVGLYTFVFFWSVTAATNAMFMWKFDNEYKKAFFEKQRLFFSGFLSYLLIPLKYSRSWGGSKKQLRLAMIRK